jgi:NAD(P)-dependent dehydrogenase (short-subunit alcohol dehydrogenase family)
MKDLHGSVALVTGAGEGVGKAVALALAARGAHVVVMGRDERALAETVGEIACGAGKARHFAGDVRDPKQVAAAVDRAVDVFGGLDIVVACAAEEGRVELGSDLARAEAILQTNLMGVYYTFDAALPRMNGPGRLLAMAPVTGDVGVTGYAALAAAGAGLLGLVRAVAVEGSAKGITCNAVGPVSSPSAGSPASPSPEQVAERVVDLCTDASSGVTGQAIGVVSDGAAGSSSPRVLRS